MQKLILVDEKDKEIGAEDKLKCHLGSGILHRAFTVFVFNKKSQLLLQKRSSNKLLWPLFWESSCSSHPCVGEDLIVSAEKRLKEEMGFSCPLKPIDKFQYQALYKNIGAEYEMCWLLAGEYNGKVRPNPDEVCEWKWDEIENLENDVKKNPSQYAPWFIIALKVWNSNFIFNGRNKEAGR